MSLYIPKMSDTPAITIPGLASNFNALANSRIVEYGENENGSYIRWADGLQICYDSKRSFTSAVWEEGGLLYDTVVPGLRYDTCKVPFPATFASTPIVAVANAVPFYGSYSRLVFGTQTTNTSTSNLVLTLYHSAGGTPTSLWSLSYIAIGRWK